MAPPARRLQTPVRLVLDWDGTLTVKDTMSFLGRLPDTRNYRQFKAAHPRHVSTSEKIHQGPRDSSLFGEPASWQRFSDVYMSDYVAHKAKHFPHGAVDQQMFRPVEEASARRVAESGFLRAVKTEDLAVEAERALSSGELQLRKGWLELFEMFRSSACPPAGSKLSIISVNWSETWIRWSLYIAARATSLSEDRKSALLHFINDMEIFANEIHGLDSPHGSSGRLLGSVRGTIRTSADKLRYLPVNQHKTSGQQAQHSSTADWPPPIVIYVGDSTTDYDCLRCADIGVWIADMPQTEYKTKFAETFKPLKYVPPSIHDLDATDASQWCVWAPNFEEVANAVAALDPGLVKSGSVEREVEDRRIARD